MNARDLLNQMADEEDRFLQRQFVAPVLKGAGVRVRVAGIVYGLAVTPAGFEGWAVLQPLDHRRARVVNEARLAQVREYLGLFPLLRLVLCERRRDTWLGLAADDSDRRFRLGGPVPLLLPRDAQLFDTVRARYDGTRFLFESKEPRRDPSVAAYLRASLAEGRPPDALEKATLTRQERTAYEWQVLLEREKLRDATEDRLKEAVAHADGKFRSFIERGDHYAVTFLVDAESHTATIRKEDFSVMLAGICLSGEDDKFDLTSLVGVIREGQDGYLVRVGDDGDMGEAAYRQVHPPRRRHR